MRIKPGLDRERDKHTERGRPDHWMVNRAGQIFVFQKDTHGWDYVCWESDNERKIPSSAGFCKGWLVPPNDLWEAEEV